MFKNLVKATPGKHPAGMAALGSKGGGRGGFNTGKSTLLMDSAKSHLGDEVEQGFTDVNNSIKIIHGGMTPLLQFLDTHVKKPFLGHHEGEMGRLDCK